MARSYRFRVTAQDGRVFVGQIQGCGGVIAAESERQREQQLARVLAEIGVAGLNRDLRIFEPRPGHCRMYLDGSGDVVDVPLAGATVAWVD
jgi:hypothetical protein